MQEVVAARYVTPLREGGSLPGIVEADDLGTYVMITTGEGPLWLSAIRDVFSRRVVA
ncbi:hypothetical protein ME763_37175 (plasmid) [Streptomyces murinus]|uniref:transposase family protein n=1 Tax=Streptomyces murinus TaxID=33900 RepID=UPI001180AF8C|nr:transposase family protein [Streptomyces murinus]WDO11386.1 hypothetical protein ME763_37175 [Streptomyces murinus]